MKSFLSLLLLFGSFSQTTFAHPDTPGLIVISKATELGVHRIERLVTLKKIDKSFQSQLYAMRAERSTEPGASYKIYGYVSPDSGGNSSTIAMLSDKDGKVMSFSVSETFQPVNPVSWPAADPLTLMENGLHFVLEGWVLHPEVKPFYVGTASLTLTPEKDSGGNLFAVLRVTSDDDDRTLYVHLKTDGSFLSYEIK